jgi:hypothetical protein
MKFLFLTFILLLSSTMAFAIEADDLKDNLARYPLPTAEQILRVGLALQDQAEKIIEQKKKDDCHSRQAGTEVEKEKAPDLAGKCIICALMSADKDMKYQLLAGKIPEKPKARSPLIPDTISLTYLGTNDQPFHGALNSLKKTGDDLNGYTYGSDFDLTAGYKWGDLSLNYSTDLYVSTYNKVDAQGNLLHYRTDRDSKGLSKNIQEADEHTSLILGSKIFAKERPDKNTSSGENSLYSRFNLGLDYDSDQGIGDLGAIAQREAWHKAGGVRNDQYVNHMEDRLVATGSEKVGVESFRPVGKLGICSVMEAGLTGATNGTVSVDAMVKASLDSGTFGGSSRETPMFILNLEGGIKNPIIKGSDPKLATDPLYNPELKNRNYSLIGDLKSAYASAGVEGGGKNVRMAFDVIYEKNQLQDKDLIYRFKVQVKY